MSYYPEICILSWSANGLRICESLDDIEVANNRSGIFRKRWAKCSRPDMFLSVDPILTSPTAPSIVVIGFTDEADNYTYLHSEYLPSYMRTRGYTPITRDKIVLENTSRISVFARTSIAGVIKFGNNIRKSNITGRLPSGIEYNYGGVIGIYINVPSLGTLAFVLVKMNDDNDSIVDSFIKDDPIIRKNYLMERDIMFNKVIQDYIHEKGIDYAWVFGKLNYRISLFDKSGNLLDTSKYAFAFERGTVDYLTYYNEMDELKREMDLGNIYEFQEGVNNSGPNFLPTCDRKLGRNILCKEECFDLGSNRIRTPSWCIRILYNNYNNLNSVINCKKYDRFESGETMTSSTNAGVYAIYEIRPLSQ